MSAEDKGRAFKSSLTEGSSRLLGSVMGAKKGIMGGLTSTFDQVVNIVGGSEQLPAEGAGDPAAADGGTSRDSDAPVAYIDPDQRTTAKIRPPKTSEPTQTGENGTGEETKSQSNNHLQDHTDESSAKQNGSAAVSGGHKNSSKSSPKSVNNGDKASPRAPGDGVRRKIHPPPPAANDDSDADSEATEGCDDNAVEDDLALEDCDGGTGGVRTSGASGASGPGGAIVTSGSRNSDQSWANDEEDEQDPQSLECIRFMKLFVQKVFDPSSEITASDKSKFGELCQSPIGRLWFAKCVNGQRVHNKCVTEQVLFNLVQFFAIVLFECNESEDYGPAKTLMNMCFTFYHPVEKPGGTGQNSNQFLYSLLKDQSIWQSPRFWNAAFFYAVQHERASKPIATSSEHHQTKTDDRSFQENITFGQLGTFTSNMRAFGLSKEQCLEFLRKQATIANLPPSQVRTLQNNMERWTDQTTTQ